MNAGADESHSSPRTSKSVASRRFRARQRLERPHWHHQVMDTTETLPSATCSEASYPLNVRIILVLMTVPTTATQDCCRKYSNGVLRILLLLLLHSDSCGTPHYLLAPLPLSLLLLPLLLLLPVLLPAATTTRLITSTTTSPPPQLRRRRRTPQGLAKLIVP